MFDSMDDVDVLFNLDPVVQLLDARIEPYAVYLFGSAVRDTFRKDSDVDLAFLSDRTLTSYEQYLVSQEAADLLHREVDLVNLQTVETLFCAQIIAHGKLLVNKDKARVANFQIRTLKEYALLNEERAVILKGIQDRGSLYA